MTTRQEIYALDKKIKRGEAVTSVVTQDAADSFDNLQEERRQKDEDKIALAESRFNRDVEKMHTAQKGLDDLTTKRCELVEKLAGDNVKVTGKLNIEDMDPIEGKWRKQRDEKRGLI